MDNIKYIKKLNKLSIPSNVGSYKCVMYKNSKFITNYNNTLYFEYTYNSSDGNLPELSEYYINIIPYNEVDIVQPGYDYICSFNNEDIVYFVYMYSPDNIFGKMFSSLSLF